MMAVLKDFICMDCSEEFDDFHTEETVCKKCGSKNLKVQIKSIRIHNRTETSQTKFRMGLNQFFQAFTKVQGNNPEQIHLEYQKFKYIGQNI